MKVGIITKIGKNYGALLQAYALRQAFLANGVQCSIINYELPVTKKSYKICKEPWRRRGIICNLKSIIHFREYKESTRKCIAFRNDFFSLTAKYNGYEMIKNSPPDCQLFVAGSDQVWNPRISFDPAYYCSFAKDDKKCISYAASIGVDKIDSSLEEEFLYRLKRFSYISVREKSAKRLLKQLGIESEIAPDPTFLLSEIQWQTVSNSVIDGPYILCYFVSFPKEAETIVMALKRKLGVKVVNLMTSEESSKIGDIKIRDAGPKEFLGLFENAAFVLTSSFHGTAFSMIFRKPFITTVYNVTSSRVVDLLETVGLLGNIYDPHNVEGQIERLLNGKPYHEDAENRINELNCKGSGLIRRIVEEYCEE